MCHTFTVAGIGWSSAAFQLIGARNEGNEVEWQDLQLSGARIRFYLISVTQQQQEAKEITETMNGSG